jgi:sarcosine oxidase
MRKNLERYDTRVPNANVERFYDARIVQRVDQPPGPPAIGETPQVRRMRRGVRVPKDRSQLALARPHPRGVPHDRGHVDAHDAAVAQLRAHPVEDRAVVAQIRAHVDEPAVAIEHGQARRVALGPGEIQTQETRLHARVWGTPQPSCERPGDARETADMTYDAIVLGLGGMGSATLAHLAQRGKRVLGIEQFTRAHDRGSSAGQSRIIRMAYYEDPAYVPLLRRAYDLWVQLERESGEKLLDLRGILMVGGPQSSILHGARASAGVHGIELAELSRTETLRRYPTLQLRADEFGLFEPHAGMVFPEAAIAAHLRVAERAGAEFRTETRARGYVLRPEAISIELDDGATLETRRLAICAGPWLGEIARELALPLRVQRNVQVWFEPATPAYRIDRFPTFFLDRPSLPAALYGFPDYGGGVKAALHGYGVTTSPGQLDRTVSTADAAPLRAALDDFMPGAAGELVAAKACMYTLTPDEHFIVDRHPLDARIVLAGGFSGHGYKFCPVIGEIIADLLIDGTTRHPIGFLRLQRLVA